MKRTFKPTRKYVGNTTIETSVDRWEWTRGYGLRCFYKDGTSRRSDYRTLRELFAGEEIIETEREAVLLPAPAYPSND